MAGVVVAGLFGLYVWFVLDLRYAPRPVLWVRSLLVRLPRGEKLVSCPWCLGFWLAAGAYVALSASEGSLSVVGTPIGAVAAAGLTGLLGTILSGYTDD